MPKRRLSRDLIGQRGSQIYEEKLQAKLEAESHGLFVAIDVETEEYEIGDESASAADRLWERLPNAQIYVERVGYPAAFHAYQSSAAHK